MHSFYHSVRMLVLAMFFFTHNILVIARDCMCGYSINDTQPLLFTDLLETDFLHLSNIRSNPCWTPQVYNVTASEGRGEYGKLATAQNVIPNPCPNGEQCSQGVRGGDAGLQLWVNSTLQDDMVPMGEILSNRADMLYGSYRVRMRVTGVPGTCGAFFWFRNNSQEIDMEFLSSAYNSFSHPVFLVMQTPESVANDYNAAGTSTYDVAQLPVNPDGGFHEYRFDWTRSSVSFYFDAKLIKTMAWTYPQMPGYLALNHWSNGNDNWSRGPPRLDAVLIIARVQVFFNSSDPQSLRSFEGGCSTSGNVCQVEASSTSTLFNGSMCAEDVGATLPSRTSAPKFQYRPDVPPTQSSKSAANNTIDLFSVAMVPCVGNTTCGLWLLCTFAFGYVFGKAVANTANHFFPIV